jgi:hypothetical protein
MQYKPLINRFGKKKNPSLAARTVVGGEDLRVSANTRVEEGKVRTQE